MFHPDLCKQFDCTNIRISDNKYFEGKQNRGQGEGVHYSIMNIAIARPYIEAKLVQLVRIN